MTNIKPANTISFTAQEKKFLDSIFNKNGKLDSREQKAFSLFADSNKDGKVSAAEKNNAFSRLKNEMGDMKVDPNRLMDLEIYKLFNIYNSLA